MEHISLYQCKTCFKILPLAHPENSQKFFPMDAWLSFHSTPNKNTCPRGTGNCRLLTSGATLLGTLDYKGYFECQKCRKTVVFSYDSSKTNFFIYPRPIHAGNCGGSLKAVSVGPIESFDAYTQKTNLPDMLQVVKYAMPTCEAHSQRNVRSHLIKRGYGFLAGPQGNTLKISQCEFTTFHPTWTIEEPGFKKGSLIGSESNVTLVPRVSCGFLSVNTEHHTFPDFVVTDGTLKIAFELKTPKTYVLTWGNLTSKTISFGTYSKTVGTDIGYTGAWLFRYANDLHIEAYWRKYHLPSDYKSILLIDLTVVGQSIDQAIQDILSLFAQTVSREPYGQQLYIYSKNWWKKYFDGVYFFYNGEIHPWESFGFTEPKPISYNHRQLQFHVQKWKVKYQSHNRSEFWEWLGSCYQFLTDDKAQDEILLINTNEEGYLDGKLEEYMNEVD